MCLNTVPICLRGVQVTVNGITEEEMDGMYRSTIYAILTGKRKM